jgi:ribosomal protein S3AE
MDRMEKLLKKKSEKIKKQNYIKIDGDLVNINAICRLISKINNDDLAKIKEVIEEELKIRNK